MVEANDQVWIGDLPEGINEEQVKTCFSNYGEIKWLKAIPGKPGAKSSALVQFDGAADAQWAVENLNGNIPEGLTDPIQVKFSKGGGKGGCKGSKDGGKAGGKDVAKGGWAAGKNGGKDSSQATSSYGKAGSKGANGKGDWQQQQQTPAAGPYSDGKDGKDGKGGKAKGKGKTVMRTLIKGAVTKGVVPSFDKPDENCVYVRGLPKDCEDRDLYELFAPFGAIQFQGVTASQKGGECSGVGFVDFCDNACTMAAIEALQGFDNGEGGTLELKQKSPGKKGKGKDKDSKGKGKGKKGGESDAKGGKGGASWGKGAGADASWGKGAGADSSWGKGAGAETASADASWSSDYGGGESW